MSASNHHLIVRQIFELEFPAGVDGFAMQQDIGQIVREKLLPRMEALFDDFAGPDELIQIDQLVLDLGHLPPAELEEVLVHTALRQLKEQLEIAVINRPPGVEQVPSAQSYFAQWLYLLEYGYRAPQMASIPEAFLQRAALAQLATETIAIARLRQLLQRQPMALVRLVRQHDESFLVHWLEALTAFSQRTLPDYRQEMSRWIAVLQENNKDLIMNHLTAHPSSRFDETFWRVIGEIVLQNPGASWTSDRLFVAVLRHFAAVGKPREVLLTFWRDLARFPKTSYPLLQQVINHHPQLLESVNQPSAPEVITQREQQKNSSERLEMPATERPEVDVVKSLKISGSENIDPAILPSDDQSVFPTAGMMAGNEVANHSTATAQQSRNQILSENPEQSVSNTSQPTPFLQSVSTPGKEAQSLDKPQQYPELPPDRNAQTLPPAKQPTPIISAAVRTGDFWYVANAGVILLHPFLSPYFKMVGLVEQGQFIDEAAQQRAVHLVHFLATGQTQVAECDLVLPRFLCGLPFDSPLERFIELTAEERAEGENLLRAAISHWNKLGSTSPDGLREGFLQRDGKLEKREPGWYLGVEQKTMDILLGFLPWNLSMIKLPWMPELLRVEWA